MHFIITMLFINVDELGLSRLGELGYYIRSCKKTKTSGYSLHTVCPCDYSFYDKEFYVQ